MAPLARSVLHTVTTIEGSVAHRDALPASHSAPASHAHGRDESIDVARGITIAAIVLGHVVLGVGAAQMANSQHVEDVTRGLYLLRLSTLAYLSGLFVRHGVERAGPRRFVEQRLLLFGWLYVLWSFIQGGIKVLVGSLANQPVDWVDVLRLWVPEGQLWFLPWLMSVTLVAVVVRPWTSRRRAAMSLGASCIFAVAIWGVDPGLIFTRGWALLPPFLIGCSLGAASHDRMFRSPRATMIWALAGGAVWLAVDVTWSAVPPTLGGEDRTLAGVALGVVGCIAGTGACLAWSRMLARSPAVWVLAPVGRRSLEIYLAHIVAASGVRILLLGAGVHSLAAHLVLGVLVGVVAPMVLAVVTARLGWRWAFGLPEVLQAPERRATTTAR